MRDWISVEAELPKVPCMVWSPTDGLWFEYLGDLDSGDVEFLEITHWQPIQPPED